MKYTCKNAFIQHNIGYHSHFTAKHGLLHVFFSQTITLLTDIPSKAVRNFACAYYCQIMNYAHYSFLKLKLPSV